MQQLDVENVVMRNYMAIYVQYEVALRCSLHL